MIDLKPCPFCGSPGKVYQHPDWWKEVSWNACCSNNNCKMHPWENFGLKEDAEAAWNTRVPDPENTALRTELAQAKAENERLRLALLDITSRGIRGNGGAVCVTSQTLRDIAKQALAGGGKEGE